MKSLLFISGLDMIQIIIDQKWFVKMSIFSPLVVTKKEYFIIITFLNRGVITKKKKIPWKSYCLILNLIPQG